MTGGLARGDRVVCPECSRDVAVKWVNDDGYYGLHTHRADSLYGMDALGWCVSAGRSYTEWTLEVG